MKIGKHTEGERNMKTMMEMSPMEVQEWLDQGNTFILPSGSGKYVARGLEDGAYVCYHYEYSTFGRLVQYSAPYGPSWTINERGVAGTQMYSMSFQEQRDHLDEGGIFTMPLANNEGFTLRKTPDGCYVMYSPERDNFQRLVSQMAQYGPAYIWEAHEDHEGHEGHEGQEGQEGQEEEDGTL